MRRTKLELVGQKFGLLCSVGSDKQAVRLLPFINPENRPEAAAILSKIDQALGRP